MKIFVAIPGRDNKLDFNVVKCILEEQEVSLRVGVKLMVNMFPSSGGIADGRNFLVDSFLKSDCDKMVFVDSDVTFNPGAIIQLALKPVDVVGGCYRHKKDEESYPIAFKEGEMWADNNGLVKVDKLPFGFICLSRRVFEKFDEKFPERIGKNFGLKSTVYFQIPIISGVLWGEDFMFCKEWNEMGESVYLDPEIELTHWGSLPTPFKGHIGNWLKGQPQNIARRLILTKGIEDGKIPETPTVLSIGISEECLPQGLQQ